MTDDLDEARRRQERRASQPAGNFGVVGAEKARIVDCKCGKRIKPCGCGGTACPGWVHLGINEGHYCGNSPDEKAAPREGERADG